MSKSLFNSHDSKSDSVSNFIILLRKKEIDLRLYLVPILLLIISCHQNINLVTCCLLSCYKNMCLGN